MERRFVWQQQAFRALPKGESVNSGEVEVAVSAQRLYNGGSGRGGRSLVRVVAASTASALGWRKVRTPPFRTVRATRLVTPGGGIREDSATESATEKRPPVRIALGGRSEAKPQAGLVQRGTGKGEKVG